MTLLTRLTLLALLALLALLVRLTGLILGRLWILGSLLICPIGLVRFIVRSGRRGNVGHGDFLSVEAMGIYDESTR